MQKNFKKHEEDTNEPVGELIEYNNINYIHIDEIPPFQNNTVLTDINNDKLIKKIEKEARNSLEYKNYFRYLKENLDMKRCSYLPNITSAISNLNVELHHCPYTLFDITKVVCNKLILQKGNALEFDICNEVMELHYKNMIGLIPLSPTVHELVHSGAIDVNPNITYGFWMKFIDEYKDFFTEDIQLKTKDILAFKDVPTTRIPDILKVKYTLLKYDGLPLYKTLSLEDQSTLKDEISIIAT